MVANKGLDVDMWFFDCTNTEFWSYDPAVTTGPRADNISPGGYGYHVANRNGQELA